MSEEQERQPVGDVDQHGYFTQRAGPYFPGGPVYAAPHAVGSALTDEEAYWQGWCEAADWANRDDLYADRDSEAYANAMKRRLAAAPAPAVKGYHPGVSGEPYGWLYDWTHSSALGKPDEHFTSFTTDEAYAKKHENVRAVCLAAPSHPPATPAVAVQAEPDAYLCTRRSGFAWSMMPHEMTQVRREVYEAEGVKIEALTRAAHPKPASPTEEVK